MIRPWLFVGPAMIILTIYLIYPVIETSGSPSSTAAATISSAWPTTHWAFGDREFRNSILNNCSGWPSCRPPAPSSAWSSPCSPTSIWWGTIAKSLIFLPMAISFVGASVIWKFIYEYRGEGQTQIGILNAIVQ